MSTSGGIRDLFRSGHRNAPAVPGVVPIRKLGREPASLSFASIDPKPQKQPPPVALRPIQEIAARVQGHVPVQNLQIARLQPKAEPHLRIKRRRRSLERTHPIEGASAPSFKPFDFCLISVPFGHYDEPEILPYETPSICPIGADVKHIALEIPVTFKRRGFETKIVIEGEANTGSTPDRALIKAVTSAHRWFADLKTGEVRSIKALAERHGVDKGDVSRILPLAFLAPDIVEAILGGRHPVDLTAYRLKRIHTLPFDWQEQRTLLGFS